MTAENTAEQTAGQTAGQRAEQTGRAGLPESVDLLGVGVGPFNLGLAALAEPLELTALFLDRAPSFDWHPGMLIHGTHLQVPFMADLVTLADPTSRFSFLNYLAHTGRMYPFYIREDFYILREEYAAYCRWVIDQLDSVRFGAAVEDLRHDGELYSAAVRLEDGSRHTVRARRISLGVGTEPSVPASAEPLVEAGIAVHTSAYLPSRDRLLGAGNVVVVGSGQSAAEAFLDLLTSREWGARGDGARLTWITRSPRFFPLEYTKLTLEMTSPEYIDHFHAMPQAQRDALVGGQHSLYKGINGDLVNEVYDELYRKSAGLSRRELEEGALGVDLFTSCELMSSGEDGSLCFRHTETGEIGSLQADAVLLATGYRERSADVLAGIEDRIRRLPDGRFDVDREYSVSEPAGEVFVQNAELHTHGFTAPDLGMGAYRNSVILRRVMELLGCPAPYEVPRSIAFQTFGAPGGGR